MSTLFEICDSAYKHQPLTEFGKKYFMDRFKQKIICEECREAWIFTTAKLITDEVMRYLENLNTFQAEGDSVTIRKKLPTPEYMFGILPDEVEIGPFVHRDVAGELAIVENECVVMFRSFDKMGDFTYTFKLNLGLTCEASTVSDRVTYYIEKMLEVLFSPMSDELVQLLMDAKSETTYKWDSDASCSCQTYTGTCAKCGCSIKEEYYIYENTCYCLNCMYNIVVEIASHSGLTDQLELSADYTGQSTTVIMVRGSDAWKRAVIDKCIIAFRDFGVKLDIVHTRINTLSY